MQKKSWISGSWFHSLCCEISAEERLEMPELPLENGRGHPVPQKDGRTGRVVEFEASAVGTGNFL